MSNLVLLKDQVLGFKKEFEGIANDLDFQKESMFALQVIEGNDFALNIAKSNPKALKNAIINVAAIGLTLSPAEKLAYLVPRKGGITLVVSYQGLCKIATDSGSVEWIHSEIVRKNDLFALSNQGKPPEHKFNPFDKEVDRGEVIGAYVVAKVKSGDFLTTTMSIEEIHSIRNRSESWKSKSGPSGPWVSDPLEMMKKTVIIRASKAWPKTKRFAEVIAHNNEVDGIDFKAEVIEAAKASDRSLVEIKGILAGITSGEKRLLAHLSDQFKVKILSVDDLNNIQAVYALGFLDKYKSKKPDVVVIKEEEVIEENILLTTKDIKF